MERNRIIVLLTALFVTALFSSAPADAESRAPKCLDHERTLAVNDAQVAQWKHSTKNQFLARAHVVGTIEKIYPNQTGHAHFEILLDGTNETLEVVYSLDFGKIPALAIGAQVEACGDYITSNAKTPQYPPSPDGAIIHWVHRSDNVKKHDSGYVVVDGRVYGQ